MAEFDDLGKAKDVINGLFDLRDELTSASPMLVEMLKTIELHEKSCDEIPEKKEAILAAIDEPINYILSIDPGTFKAAYAMGATGSFYNTSGDTRTIITSYGSKYYHLIEEYDEINKTEIIIERILDILAEMDVDLYMLMEEAKSTYGEWKADAKNNSDLSKDIRNFQDHFKGYLHQLRVKKNTAEGVKSPDFSWSKMADAIGKSGSGFVKTLKHQQGVNDKLHLEFTTIMKLTQTVTKEEMDRFFKDYIEHVYTILTCIV